MGVFTRSTSSSIYALLTKTDCRVQFVTGLLQTLYYRVTISAGRRHPQPGEPLYAYHHRRIRILVLCLYLVYTLAQALYDTRLAGDFYSILGVTPESTDREVKARFRRLAARYHPDKIRDNAGYTTVTDFAFVQLKLAQDTILDPAKRFAYDRFGPMIVQVQHPGLQTIRDYVYAGLGAKIPEYVMSALGLVALNYFWLPKWGQFWRYLVVAMMAFLELYFLTHTWRRPMMVQQSAAYAQRLFPNYLPGHLLPFQILSLAKRMSMSLNIFISQLAPPMARAHENPDRHIHQQISHLVQAANRIDAEASSFLQLGLTPFKNDSDSTKVLRSGMKDTIIMSAIRNSAEVRTAVRQALDRRRGGTQSQGLD